LAARPGTENIELDVVEDRTEARGLFVCDRCGVHMLERMCKLICPNCGNQFDCSDLNVYFD
jgi:hypothetical protein